MVIWSEYVVNVWLTGMVRVPIRLPVQVDRPLSRELQVRLLLQKAIGRATCKEGCRSGYLYRELQVRLPVLLISTRVTYFLWFYYERQRSSKS